MDLVCFEHGQEAPDSVGMPDHAPQPVSSDHGVGGPRKATKQRRRSNRDAQARYRQKCKQQEAEVHARMMRLEAQVAEAKGAVERERACEAENARLRSALARHEDIILEEFKRAAMLTAHCDASVTAAAAAEYQQATSTVQAHKEDLCRLLAHAGLPLDHVRTGMYAPPAVMAELVRLVSLVSAASMKQLAKAMAAPLAAIQCSSAPELASWSDRCRVRWQAVMQKLGLDSSQQEHAVRARREAQMQLDTLAADSIIITFTSISPPNDGAVFAQSNSNHAAQLKQLFSQERKVVLQLHETFVKKVLSPMQAAVMFVQACSDCFTPLAAAQAIAMQAAMPPQPAVAPPSAEALTHDDDSLLFDPFDQLLPPMFLLDQEMGSKKLSKGVDSGVIPNAWTPLPIEW